MSRNNIGSARDATGRYIKYGVFGVGGSDCIGWTTVEITPEMVGTKVAIFTAIEVKTETGRVRPEQINFIDIVKKSGGRAGIARSVDDAMRIVDGRDDTTI